jgi:hypothetical protein
MAVGVGQIQNGFSWQPILEHTQRQRIALIPRPQK